MNYELITIIMLMFDYNLIMNCGLIPNGRLVDRLPYPRGWVKGVHCNAPFSQQCKKYT